MATGKPVSNIPRGCSDASKFKTLVPMPLEWNKFSRNDSVWLNKIQLSCQKPNEKRPHHWGQQTPSMIPANLYSHYQSCTPNLLVPSKDIRKDLSVTDTASKLFSNISTFYRCCVNSWFKESNTITEFRDSLVP